MSHAAYGDHLILTRPTHDALFKLFCTAATLSREALSRNSEGGRNDHALAVIEEVCCDGLAILTYLRHGERPTVLGPLSLFVDLDPESIAPEV